MFYPDREYSPPSRPSPRSELNRFLGGSPLAVAVRLILLSVVVGVVLSAIGFDPYNVIESIQSLIRFVWNMGFDAVDWLWRYFLLGAAVVVPIWLIVRLTSGWR
ncbi:MAG: DUF6460 domain-containing protein [Xanthobacteraceae bacterium]